jgi:hypothetical protein
MREVAWVVFDEVHYMRDKGESTSVLADSRTWCCLGRNDHPPTSHGSLRLPIRDHPKLDGVCRMDLQDTRTAVSRRLHRL